MSKILPRYLYHITSKANYEAIKRSGILKQTKPEDACNGGIFMIELTNFFKHWKFSKDWDGNLGKELLAKIGMSAHGDIVLLRIPTKNINSNRLRIRSQNALSKTVKLNEEQKRKVIHEITNSRIEYFETECRKGTSIESIQEEIEKRFPLPDFGKPFVELSEHIRAGSPAKERKLFQQRKEAIEYIYTDDIPYFMVEKIGETNFMNELLSFGDKISIKNIFSKLLNKTPEEKTTFLLKD